MDARNLRTAERYVIAPPLVGTFGDERISLCDISGRGARLMHANALEPGTKRSMRILVDGKVTPLTVDALVVWCQPEAGGTAGFVSGVRLYADLEAIRALVADLQEMRRCTRIEELRATDRFYLMPALKGTFAGRPVYIEDLSAHGARIEMLQDLAPGAGGKLAFALPDSEVRIGVSAKVIWTAPKSMTGQFVTWRSGLHVGEAEGALRAAITTLAERGNATLDTHSLRLKLKVMRARARRIARTMETPVVGLGAEQVLLIEGVRQELRLNPEEAFHWYRRARLSIADPQTRTITPPISDHPDALAVWEYLDRSIDPSIIGRVFELHLK